MSRPKDERITFEKMIPKSEIINSSVLVKKSALDEVGGFDENPKIFTGEDYELWLRLVHKYNIRFIGDPLVKYRIHSGALQNEFLAGDKSIQVAREIYKGLLKKHIIDNGKFNDLLKKLNYEHMIIRLINRDKTLDFKQINHVKVNLSEKIRLVIFYSLYRLGLLKTLREMRGHNEILQSN
jgi:hypothetical protein